MTLQTTSPATLAFERADLDGYAVLRDAASDVAGFRTLADGWGRILRETHVRLKREVKTYLCQPAPVPFHTDHPDVHFIAWLCVAQDQDGGANELVDGLRLVERMGPDQKAALLRTFLESPTLDALAPAYRHPLLREEGDRLRLYYAPWHAASARQAPATGDALRAFEKALSEAVERDAVRVRLEPGDVLLVDNRRMLHGRSAVREDSRRHLVRLWLTRDAGQAR